MQKFNTIKEENTDIPVKNWDWTEKEDQLKFLDQYISIC